MERKRIYMDYAATTPIDEKVFDAMLPFMKEQFGNPSSVYFHGREAKKAVERARENIARILKANANEVYFTGGGSESDNWAVKGIAYANKHKGKHIITSSIEHHAVLHTCQYLEKKGYDITYLPVDENGLISINDLKKAIRKDTILISIMFANNEIGTVQPIKEIGEIAKENGVYFHTDAVQALGNVSIDVKEMNIDLLSISSHKIYGPKGIGALYIRKGTLIDNLIHGGAQERRKRAGTENTAGIVGFGKAAEIMEVDFEKHVKHLTELRDYLINGIVEKIEHIKLNGHDKKRLPGNVNFSFQFIEGEALLLNLDIAEIEGSSGSACTSGSLDPSHVLLAIGLSHEIAHGSLRLTIGRYTTKEDVDYVLSKLPGIVKRLRDMSPLYEEIKGGKANV